MIELTKNMRQKDDQLFTELLNRFRTASQTEGDIQCIQSRLVHPEDTDYPVSIVLYFWDSFFCISLLTPLLYSIVFFPMFNHQFFPFLSINYFTCTCSTQYSVMP